MSRVEVPRSTQTKLLVESRRRCALCFGLSHDTGVKRGQIAHVDQDASNNEQANLVWLCLDHHDQYDSRTSQSKGLTPEELRHHRDELYAFNRATRAQLDPGHPHVSLSPGAMTLAQYLSERSTHAHKFDPMERIEELPEALEMGLEELQMAVDELLELGLVELNGTDRFVFPLERLFWETDPLFSENDPVLDAQEVARFMITQEKRAVDFSTIAEELDWLPRRLNPAAMYLVDTGYADARSALGTAPYARRSLVCTVKTKRFVRDLQMDQEDDVQ